MGKVLEDSLGNLEYLLLGLTFLGVLYLVLKQANVKMSAGSKAPAEPFSGNAGIRFLTEATGTTGPNYSPNQRGYEGMGSMSGNEAPVWHATAFLPDGSDSVRDLSQLEVQAAGVDYNQLGARRNFGANGAVSAHPTTFNVATEGMGSYARRSVESMQDKLMSSLAGGSVALQ